MALIITRKTPKKDEYNKFGDRNKLIIQVSETEEIEIGVSKGPRTGEVRLAISGPKKYNILRKESLTGDNGPDYEENKKRTLSIQRKKKNDIKRILKNISH